MINDYGVEGVSHISTRRQNTRRIAAVLLALFGAAVCLYLGAALAAVLQGHGWHHLTVKGGPVRLSDAVAEHAGGQPHPRPTPGAGQREGAGSADRAAAELPPDVGQCGQAAVPLWTGMTAGTQRAGLQPQPQQPQRRRGGGRPPERDR